MEIILWRGDGIWQGLEGSQGILLHWIHSPCLGFMMYARHRRWRRRLDCCEPDARPCTKIACLINLGLNYPFSICITPSLFPRLSIWHVGSRSDGNWDNDTDCFIKTSEGIEESGNILVRHEHSSSNLVNTSPRKEKHPKTMADPTGMMLLHHYAHPYTESVWHFPYNNLIPCVCISFVSWLNAGLGRKSTTAVSCLWLEQGYTDATATLTRPMKRDDGKHTLPLGSRDQSVELLFSLPQSLLSGWESTNLVTLRDLQEANKVHSVLGLYQCCWTKQTTEIAIDIVLIPLYLCKALNHPTHTLLKRDRVWSRGNNQTSLVTLLLWNR